MQLIPFVAKADETECTIKRAGNIPLHARQCKKEGNTYRVRSCDTDLACKASEKNVKMDPSACEDSISAPRFQNIYSPSQRAALLQLLESQPQILTINFTAKPSPFNLNQLTTLHTDQKVALFKFTPKIQLAGYQIEHDSELATALAKNKVEYLYAVRTGQASSLVAYAVSNAKLKKVPPQDVLPTCGDN